MSMQKCSFIYILHAIFFAPKGLVESSNKTTKNCTEIYEINDTMNDC